MIEQFITKIRQYEIRIRKAVNADMRGSFRSVFKGSGLEFTDLREYQYGDDVRTIDWNVSAKGHGTFVKIFREEKEQTVFFLLDVSGSQQVGDATHVKLDTAKEICGVLALSAIQEETKLGPRLIVSSYQFIPIFHIDQTSLRWHSSSSGIDLHQHV